MRRAVSLLLGAPFLLIGQSASAQFLIEGVIHDSRTLAPISDVVVLVVDDATGAPISPGLLAEPTQQGQITGADGRYRLELQDNLQVRISLSRPDARFVFPSVIAPPAGLACTEVRCDGGMIGVTAQPAPDPIYAIRFRTSSGQGARNNHIPIDSLGELIRFELTADRDRARRGEHVTHRVEIENLAPDPIPDAELAIVLPGALRYLPGTERPPELVPSQSDLQIRFSLPLEPNTPVVLRFATKVAVVSREPRVVTRATLERGGGIVLAERTAELTLSGDPNLDLSTILGRVFCEKEGGRAGWQDEGEPGLYAARIYLDTGFYVESDADGLFSFTGVPPGIRYLKLDEGSLPPKSTPRSPIRRELYLSPGMPGKVSFAIDCRFDTLSKATRIEVAEKERAKKRTAAPPPGARTLRVGIDADAGTIALDERLDRFLEARIEGELLERAIRFHLSSIGPATPSRWTILLEEIAPDGTSRRTIRDPSLTGRGHPPLFVDLEQPLPPPGSAYRARLELEAGDADRARSPPIDLVAGPEVEPPQPIGRAEAESLERGLEALRGSIDLSGDRRVAIEAHWDAGEGMERAQASAEELGRRAKELLVKLGVREDRIDVVPRGAEAPLFPSIGRLRVKNRRVELSLVTPPRVKPPPAAVRPRAIDLVVDKKTATVPLDDRANVDFTMDLEVPAQVVVTYHDGRGGESRMVRVVTHDWVSRPGQRRTVAPAVDPDSRELDLGPLSVPLPLELLEIESARLVTEGLELSLAEREGIERWRIEIRDRRSGRLIARRSGESSPPASLDIAYSSTAAATLIAIAEYADRARWEPFPVLLPEWAPEKKEMTISGRALADPKAALAELIDRELESPPAKIALRADGGTEEQRRELLAKLSDLPIVVEPPLATEGELRLTARLAYREEVALPEAREQGEIAPYGLGSRDAQIEMEASDRVLAIEEPLGLLVVPLPDLGEALGRAEPPGTKEEATPVEVDETKLNAAQIELTMPVSGEVLERASLPVVGRTLPINRIRINGEQVAVDSTGRFAHTLELEPGSNEVRIESIDPEGNVAIFERQVESSSIAWFLMAMGEGSASLGGAHLAGSNDDTRAELGPFSLDGRIVAYGKARFAFRGPIERLTLTGRFDSAEQGDSTIYRLSDDPFRLLPSFGDASLEVQDGATRHKGYLDLTADRSHITIGNSSTELAPFGDDSFFFYRRAGFGVHAEVAHSFSDWDDTRIAGTYSFENEGSRRGHDELQGTGGTMYWLSHDELVEGSQHVRLVVRDRDTGMVLTSHDQIEGEHYEIRPREGRIVFRQPVPNVVGIAPLAMNRSVALTGHPIYVVVDYEYLASGSDDRSWGVDVRETLFSQVELYFGAAGEERVDGDHRLFAGAIAWRPAAGSYVEIEYARSSGGTGLGAISVDGGLNYAPFDRPIAPGVSLDARNAPFFNAFDPEAISIAAHLDFADLSDAVDGPRGFVHAYGRKAGLTFSSLSTGREQGRLAGGIAASYGITDRISARVSFDAASTIQPELLDPNDDATPSVFRMLAVLGADYRDADNGVSLEVGHLRTVLSEDLGTASATGVSARYERRLTKDVSIGIAQDALFGNDLVTGGGLGGAATTAFGFWRLTDDLQLSLAETVRWNGDNATQVGLRIEGDDGFVAYVAERFSESGSEARMTTVIGAEDRVAEGSRTYGEMQMDGAHPDRMRAVIGMDNRWRVAEGLDLMLAYERAQLTSPGAPSQAATRFTAPFNGTSATLGGFGTEIAFLDGAVSRDAIAAGISWTGLPRLKLSQRFELRIDDASAAMGTDYLIIGSHTGLAFSLHRDISTIGRLTIQHVSDTTNDRTYARSVEGSVAAVYRPRAEDWFTLVLRYTKLIIQRPESLDPLRSILDRDAFSAEPIVDTPWNLQLVERVAFVRNGLTQEGLPPLSGWMLLWVNRLNARFFDVLEAGVEYRMLLDLELDSAERGFLIEAGYLPVEYVRIGVGYNFTRFSDDVLALADRDASGPFLRVTARY